MQYLRSFPVVAVTARLAVLLLLSAAFGRPQALEGQNIYAAVHGTVTDTSDAAIPGAAVSIVNTSTGISTTATTDGHGYFIFPQLQIGGPYSVTVTASGFQKFTSSGLTLDVNANREVDARMAIGSAVQTIEVQAAAVQVETADSQLKQVFTAQQMEEAPLLGRDVTGLQKLAPGVMESSDRYGNFASNGSQTQSNAYLVNGADITDASLQSEGLSVNPDALAEQNIVTSTLNPEFARNSGAIVNQVLKSGTNSLHGSGFEFYRDTFLTNGSYFAPGRPNFHQNLYGGTLGGPVIKNRLFFFLAYQGFRNRVGQTQLSPVLNPSQVNGNFSGDNNVVNDGANNVVGLSSNPMPFAIGGCEAGTPWSTCFPTGSVQLPTSSYNPISSKLLQQFVPAANSTVGGGAYYAFNAPNTAAQDQGIIRADYHLSKNDSLWASSIFQSSPRVAALGYGGSDLPGFGTVEAEHYKIFMASWTHTLGATALNELRAGYYRLNFATVEPAQVVQPSTYGFDISPQSPMANLPLINVSGLNGTTASGPGAFLGFTYEGPQPRKDTNLNASDNFSKVVGQHSLKFGVSYEQFGVNNPYFADNNGNYGFSGSGVHSSGDPILDFVLGIPDSYVQASGSVIDAIGHEYYVYAQDSWKVSDNLTLNYGIAWDTEQPYQNHQFNGLGIVCWNPQGTQTSSVYPGGPPGLTYSRDPGCNIAGGVTAKYNHFGPRIGFAWSPSSGPASLLGTPGSHKFVVRGGFGMYWNRDAEEGQLQNLGDPPGFKNSFGAGDFGGSPSFANPFMDIATGVSEPNPFPYAYPAPGSQLNWANYAELSISTYPKDYTVPYVYNFNLNVQRELPSNMVLQLGYVGSIGHKLVRAYEGDPITAAGHAACLADASCSADGGRLSIDFPQYFTQPAIVPGTEGEGSLGNGIPAYISVGQQHTDGSSNYNAFQASLTKGTTHGLYFTLAYTYSHALDNASGYESSGANGRGVNNIPGFEYLNYGDSDYDARQRLAMSYNYEVPIFGGWHDNLILREALGGWHISGVTALQTGFPVTVQDKGAAQSLYCNAGQFLSFYNCPDTPVASSFNIQTFNPRNSNHQWFDPTLFTQEPLGSLGNVKRNFFHGPGFNYTNLSLYKDFPLGAEKSRYVQLRVEAFNAFNHANFGQPDGNYTDGPGFFGVVTSVSGSTTADLNTDPQPGRAVQLVGKFFF
ncbi:MAG: carboxypeptidase-like regulatory domain-containing protein [Acidobacteriaceae bacterium]